MIEYQTAATFAYRTNVKPEAGLEKEVRESIKYFIEQNGVDTFLDKLEYEGITERELTEEELDALYDDDDLLIPVKGLKETLTAVSLGILELEGITKEQAIEALKKL